MDHMFCPTGPISPNPPSSILSSSSSSLANGIAAVTSSVPTTMGGRRGSRTQRRHFSQSRENVWKRSKSAPGDAANGDDDGARRVDLSWQPFSTQNPAFDEYYKEQGIVSAEEWDTFIDYLRKPLPAAFRINSSGQFCTDIRSQLENDFMRSLQSEIIEEGELVPLRPLAWYPENLAWHSNFSRMQLRKNQSLERFHEFLKLENEIGNITRQEAVSMVPPLFLDVHSDHFVLDMCAAPGSKTFQLLEIMHQGIKPGVLPDGLVMANDLDVQRCNLLIHQTKRMCTANLIVTNHEAQQFPGCRVTKDSVSGSDTGVQRGPSSSQLLFDRVLCDVPCSGDGTLRKAPDIWRKWHTGMGNGIHGLQVQIAMRGMSLLKVGGRMVYSTCSMNPVEDEAVVAEILRRCGGSVELLDVSNELPQLVRRAGLRKWKIHDRGTWLASYADLDSSRRTVIMPSMFPPSLDLIDETGEKSELRESLQNGSVSDLHLQSNELNGSINVVDKSEEAPFIPLERCMRIVPHDQNGGAFFIAVLHKVANLPVTQKNPGKEENSLSDNVHPEETEAIKDSENCPEISTDGMHKSEPISDVCLDDSEECLLKQESSTVVGDNDSKDAEESGAAENNIAKVGSKRKLQMQGKWRGVDPVVIFKDEAVVDSIRTFYGITDSFPFTGHLVTRNNETSRVKRIYYISKSVRDLLELNFKVGEQLKITSIGLKMFERQTSREGTSAPCSFRISSEGLPLILPYITKQILHASVVDFKHLLQYKSVKFGDFVDAELGEKASQLLPGCCVIVLKNNISSDAEAENSSIAIGCWRGRASLSVMVTAIDCQELLERLLARKELKNEVGPHEEKPLNEIDLGNNDEKQEEQIDDTSMAADG